MIYEFGQRLRAALADTGSGVELVCWGLPAGMPVDAEAMTDAVAAMGPWEAVPARDPGMPRILSGVCGGVTTGEPLVLGLAGGSAPAPQGLLPFRPSENDLGLWAKWGGGVRRPDACRTMALLAALGGICRAALAGLGIVMGTHIAQCGDVRDAELPECDVEELRAQLSGLEGRGLPMLDSEGAEALQALLEEAREGGDTLGGTLETAVVCLPAGLGRPDACGVEAGLARNLFALPGVKGVEFGMGFGFAYLCGSEANDQLVAEDGRIGTKSNLSGGADGGLTNGMPLIFRTVFRPEPAVAARQQTVDPATLEERELTLDGPYDTMAFCRARGAVEGVTAAVLLDLLLERRADRWPRGCGGDEEAR